MKDFEHTQPLPRVSPDMVSQETQVLNVSKVRELDPVSVPRQQRTQGQPQGNAQYEDGYNNAGYAQQGYGQPNGTGYAQGNNAGYAQPTGAQGYAQQGYNNQQGYGAPSSQGYNNQPNYGGPNGPQNYGQPPRGPREPEKSGKGKMIALLVVVFIVAIFLGAAISGYMSDQQAKQSSLDSQQATATQQIKDADTQEQSLTQRKSKLEAQYQKLLEQQKEAQTAADTLKGQKAQQEKTQNDKSTAGKVLDKITGDDAKQSAEADATSAQEADAQQKLENITQSVQAASDAIDEVNDQLDKLEAMRQEAKTVKANVDKAYSENKDIIDTVLHYVSLGFSGIFGK